MTNAHTDLYKGYIFPTDTFPLINIAGFCVHSVWRPCSVSFEVAIDLDDGVTIMATAL